MKMLISDNRKVQQIRDQFTEQFPYLKLEFFSRSHKPGRATPKVMMKSHDQTIGECRTVRNQGQIDIIGAMTVVQLEQQFREDYGLNVQVFRKSGKVWLETTVTDGWTLEQQNSQGEALSGLSYTRDKDA